MSNLKTYEIYYCQDEDLVIRKAFLDNGFSEYYLNNNHFWGLFEIDKVAGTAVFVGDDGGEPEDKCLVRDFEWIKFALEEKAKLIYELECKLQAIQDAADEEQDEVWARRANYTRCRCTHWVNSPKCQAVHAEESDS